MAARGGKDLRPAALPAPFYFPNKNVLKIQVGQNSSTSLKTPRQGGHLCNSLPPPRPSNHARGSGVTMTARRVKPSTCTLTPCWDRPTLPSGISKAPFEPLMSAPLKALYLFRHSVQGGDLSPAGHIYQAKLVQQQRTLSHATLVAFAGALRHMVDVELRMHLLEMARCNTPSRCYRLP